MRRPFIILFFLALLFTAAGLGCTTIPQTHYYLLGLEEHATPPTATNEQGLEIGVKDFLVDPPYNQDRIVYRIGSRNTEVGFYAYHRWAVPLSRMLPKLVAGSFSGMPGIASIEPILSGRSYSAILEGRVMSLEEIDIPEGQQVYARITLRLRLRDGTVIWSDVLTGGAMTETGTVGAIVEQMKVTLIVLLARGREGLASALLKTP